MKFNKGDLLDIFDVKALPEGFIFDTEKILTDTRKLKNDQYFFAIEGQFFDGNKFIDEAIKKGASILISQKNNLRTKVPNLFFQNDREALKKLSELVLGKTQIPKYAITGSNGKTTTREILYILLSAKFLTLKTEGNFNNNIGLPLTIFRLKPEHQCIILEMGMSALGEIDQLGAMVKPDWSIITNVGKAHLKFLINLDNIAKAKCELIPHTSKATIINKDYDVLLKHATKNKNKLLFFSLTQETDIFLTRLIENGLDFSKFIFRDNINSETIEIRLPLSGMHNISNYLAAYITSRISGITSSDILKATSSIKPFKGRFETIKIGDLTVINDCYNANPDSMMAGLSSFSRAKNKTKIALLGDMLELGENEKIMHYDVGKFLSQLEIDKLVTFGNLAKNIGEGALRFGFKNVVSFEKFEDLVDYLKKTLTKKDALYVKASNATNLDRVCTELNINKGE